MWLKLISEEHIKKLGSHVSWPATTIGANALSRSGGIFRITVVCPVQGRAQDTHIILAGPVEFTTFSHSFGTSLPVTPADHLLRKRNRSLISHEP